MSMNIELKKLKIHNGLSEESICFEAQLWVDGKHVANAYNRGNGGASNYHRIANAEECQQALDKAEMYCKSMPPRALPYGDEKIEINMNLTEYIDKLVEDAEIDKQIQAKCKKAICYGIPGADTYSARALRTPVSQLTEAVLIEYVQQIKPSLQPGEVILNKNIPSHIINANI